MSEWMRWNESGDMNEMDERRNHMNAWKDELSEMVWHEVQWKEKKWMDEWMKRDGME